MVVPEIVYYLNNNVYVKSLVILISFFIVAKIVVYISEKYILKLTSKTKTDVDDLIIKKINKPISFLLFLIGLRLAIIPLPLTEKAARYTNNIASAILIIIVAYVIIHTINILINNWGLNFARKTKTQLDESILSLLHKVSGIVIVIITLLMILNLFGIKIGALLASLGIAGLAVAFALQPTLSNIFGGISLIMDKTVRIGDIIKLDSGEMGTVHSIGIRSTKIKTWDNEIVAIPNGKLVDSKVQNFSMPDPSARINIEFSVEYGSDVEKVKKLVVDTIKSVDNVVEEPEIRILFLEMADFGLKFKVMFWVKDMSERWPAHQEAITKIYNALNKAKIGIPFPTQTIYVKK